MVDIDSPLPGVVVKVLVKNGDQVDEGTPLVILQVMKTECPIPSPVSGKVTGVFVSEGQEIEQGAKLVSIS
ncbi:MAG: acyl-CoA carboxylase biotin carboxyl carrier protein subunit [Candidatus Hecatellaceae archaeon]